jgi:hypothetical protein
VEGIGIGEKFVAERIDLGNGGAIGRGHFDAPPEWPASPFYRAAADMQAAVRGPA